MPYIQYGNTPIHYSIYKQNRKDVRIVVDLVNGVVVYAPLETTDDQIHNILSDKAKWIHGKLQELNEIKKDVLPIEFVSGEKLPYLGRRYRLKVYQTVKRESSINLKQGKFIATVPSYWTQEKIQTELEHDLINWYRHHGLLKINERAKYYEGLLGVEAKTILLRTQHKRWGTCTPEGNIYLNWRIVMAPIHVIDYIIVHELAHLRIREHSQEFWNLVRSILPNYEQDKEWLRIHGMELYCLAHEKDMTSNV